MIARTFLNSTFPGLARCRRGAGALEFALVLPAFILLVVGGIYATIMVFTEASMQFAVEDAARCASVRTSVCADGPSTTAYAKARFFGPAPPPAFRYDTVGCGHTVMANETFVFDLGVTKANVPLTATACFP